MIFFLFPNRSVKQSKLLIGDAIDQFSVVLKKKKNGILQCCTITIHNLVFNYNNFSQHQ